MSLNQKYTWADFLKEHPEHKEKGTKRTSSEGKKAFESAYKTHIKKYLVDRTEKTDKLITKATERRKNLVTKTKEHRKAEHFKKMKHVDKRISKIDAAVARHNKFKDQNKKLQKSFK